MSNHFDIVIVGAGPAGMFAAWEIISREAKRKVALIDMGPRVEKRNGGDVMSGFGGAGTYSDGKLHYTPKLSHERILHLIDTGEYQKLLDKVEATFKKLGVTAPFYPGNNRIVKNLIEDAQKQDIELVVRRTQHVGTNKLKRVIQKFQDWLEHGGVTLIENTKVADIIVKDGRCTGVIDVKGNKYQAEKVLLAPGRVNARWLQDLAKKHGMKYQYDMVEVGVRAEFPQAVMRKYAEALYEIVFKIRTPTFDDIVRTFCSCPNGFVAVETYDDYVCVNGHSLSNNEGENSNFALVCEVHLTEPVENSIAYAESIAKLASTIGGGKPILQRLEDLRQGRRSTWSRLKKSIVNPSLTEVTPGDIAMALPYRMVTNILEGLEILDKVMPGINAGSTLLYAPEVKFRSSKIITDAGMQTGVKNLYVAGDAGGFSGSITGAAATGMMAAKGMLK